MNDQTTSESPSPSAACSASSFPGRLVQHVSPNLTHSLFMAVWKPTYHDKWQGSCPYESLDELRKQYSWLWHGDYEVRVYELQLPTGAIPLQNATGMAAGADGPPMPSQRTD